MEKNNFDEEDFSQYTQMAKKNFSRITVFLEEFSKMENFGEWIFPKAGEGFPYLRYKQIVFDFISEFRKFQTENPDFSSKDWKNILEKNQIPANFHKMANLNVNLLNAEVVVALITRVIRGERFSDGMINSYLKKGIIQRYLRRLVEIDNLRD